MSSTKCSTKLSLAPPAPQVTFTLSLVPTNARPITRAMLWQILAVSWPVEFRWSTSFTEYTVIVSS